MFWLYAFFYTTSQKEFEILASIFIFLLLYLFIQFQFFFPTECEILNVTKIMLKLFSQKFRKNPFMHLLLPIVQRKFISLFIWLIEKNNNFEIFLSNLPLVQT